MIVYIVTSEQSDYCQHGEYFEGVYLKKSDAIARCQALGGQGTIEHYENGGGRVNHEYVWYFVEGHEV